MTDSPQADRPRSAETARAQEIRARWIDEDDRKLDWSLHGSAERGEQAVKDIVFILDQLRAAQEDRDRYRTLAGIGTWHKECRPNREMAARELAKSQIVIDKLADRITELESALQARASAGGTASGADATALIAEYRRIRYCSPSDPWCSRPTVDNLDHFDGHTTARDAILEQIFALAQPPASAPSVATGSDEPILDAHAALIQRWRAQATQAQAWANEEAAKDDGWNAHAHRKERRIWTTCADELAALVAPPPDAPTRG